MATAERTPLPEASRKRLEKVFAVATKKATTAASPTDFDYVTDLLAQCVSADPGNAFYVSAYLENLHKKFSGQKKAGTLGKIQEKLARLQASTPRNAAKKALVGEQWDEVIRQGIKALAVDPYDVATLIAMATAAKKSGDRDCEKAYLELALRGNPKDAACNRLYAMALADRGLINQAITFWHRVEEFSSDDDEEAKRNIAALTVQKARSTGKFDEDDEATRRAKLRAQQQQEMSFEQRLRKKIEQEPETLANYLELAQYYVNDERFAEGEKLLAKAFEISDADVSVGEKWEDCQLRLLRQKVTKATDLETKKQLQIEYIRKELEVYKRRVERYPNDLTFRYELGYRYMKLKQFDEAIRELQNAQNEPRKKGACMLALGECFMHIRQYQLAKKYYEAAIQELPDREAESKKRAYYLAGRLALEMKDLDLAEKRLATVAGLDFTYRDVKALLDKIAKLRDNPESVT
jgi:tetratricopeptide (TPR) repeat protein